MIGQSGENNMRLHLIFAVLTVIAVPLMARAEEAPKVPGQIAALQACRAKADAAERLACYDKAVDVLSAATASRDLVVIDKAEVKQARKGLFGFTLPRIPFLSSKEGDPDDDADSRELQTTVVSARRWNRIYWRFSVEGGGTWETTEDKRGFTDPKPGASVIIERGTLGAYYAKIGRGGRAAVRRIQ
jgi:hypothetical protein